MAKVLSLLAQYDRDDGDGDVRERAIVIMNSFVWQVGLDHMIMTLIIINSSSSVYRLVCTVFHFVWGIFFQSNVVCNFGNDLN